MMFLRQAPTYLAQIGDSSRVLLKWTSQGMGIMWTCGVAGVDVQLSNTEKLLAPCSSSVVRKRGI